MSRRKPPQQQTMAALFAAIQHGMIACMLFTTFMGAILFAALYTLEIQQTRLDRTNQEQIKWPAAQ